MDKAKKEAVRFGLIGCGAIARKHVIALKQLDNTKIVGAYDIDQRTAKDFRKKYGIPIFTDVETMVRESSPDVFNIVTPSGDHGERILDLVRFNKHFVVEKPLALRLDEIDEILRECDMRKLNIYVVQQNRFNPPIQKLKEALEKQRFGKLVLGTVRVRWRRDQDYYDQKPWRGTWAYDGGVLTNQASHHIDMLIWMMGEVESVMAKTATRLVNIETEDTGVAIIKFKNGALGIIEATTATRPRDLEGSISILGEKGSVEVGGFFMNELRIWDFCEPAEIDRDIWETFARVPEELAWNYTEFFKDVTDSLRSGRKGLIDGLEGRRSVELINAIYESAETGKEIFFKYVPVKSRLGIRNDK